MKKIVLTLGAIALSSIANVQADSAGGNAAVALAIPVSCSFPTQLTTIADTDLSISGTNFTGNVPIGSSSCNTTSNWTLTSAYGGLDYDGTNVLPYTAVVAFGNGDNAALTSSSLTNGGSSVSPFNENLVMVLSNIGAINPDTLPAGNYSDVITINVTY